MNYYIIVDWILSNELKVNAKSRPSYIKGKGGFGQTVSGKSG